MFKVEPKPFYNINEAISQLALELFYDGSDVTLVNAEKEISVTHELLNSQIIFEPNYCNMITIPSRKWNYRKNVAEFMWYMTGNNSVEPILKYFKNWNRFQTNGVVNSNYGVRWKEAINYIINELKYDKYSRRAVINMYDVTKSETFFKDTPCTLTWQFIIRNNYLHMFVYMRSNDIWYGFCNDQFNNSLLHQLVLNELKQTYPEIRMGRYYHNTTSMHSYESTCNKDKLSRLYYEFCNDKTIENKRFELDESVTFNNFWDELNPLFIDFKSEYEHFRKYVK